MGISRLSAKVLDLSAPSVVITADTGRIGGSPEAISAAVALEHWIRRVEPLLARNGHQPEALQVTADVPGGPDADTPAIPSLAEHVGARAVSSSSWAGDETASPSVTLSSTMTADNAHAHASNFSHGAPAKVDNIEVELASSQPHLELEMRRPPSCANLPETDRADTSARTSSSATDPGRSPATYSRKRSRVGSPSPPVPDLAYLDSDSDEPGPLAWIVPDSELEEMGVESRRQSSRKRSKPGR
jgi:hypothetical protein